MEIDSSSAKRRRSNSPPSSSGGGGDNSSDQRGRSAKKSRTAATTTGFAAEMNRLLGASMKQLAVGLQQGLAKFRTLHPEKPCPPAHILDEYLRAEAETNYRFSLDTTGVVFATGNNDSNQLAYDDVTAARGKEMDDRTYGPRRVRQLLPHKSFKHGVRQVAAGALHSVALCDNGVPYTWGQTDKGCIGRTVGDGDDKVFEELKPTALQTFRSRQGDDEGGTIRQVAAGEIHCLFVSLKGNLYQCGAYRDPDSVLFKDSDEDGERADVEGFNAAPVHVRMPGNLKVIRAYTGAESHFNAALLSDGLLYTWGFGTNGELARSKNMKEPDARGRYKIGREWYVMVVDDRKRILTDIIRKHFLTPAPVIYENPDVKKTVLSVACGESHLLVAAREAGQFQSCVYSAGLNSFGQIGNGQYVSPKAEENDDSLRMEIHQLEKVQALKHESISQVAAGKQHSMALTHDGMVLYAWGKADVGQLGLGYAASQVTDGCQPIPQVVDFPMPSDGIPRRTKIRTISAGSFQSMAISVDNELYTWGEGDFVTGHKTPEDQHVYRPTKLDLPQTVESGDEHAAASWKQCDVFQAVGGSSHSLFLANVYTKAAEEATESKEQQEVDMTM